MADLIKASDFVRLSDKSQKMINDLGHYIVINDKFLPFFNNREKLVFIYGSYGNGKSKFTAQDLVEKCRTDEYFKCFYGRKIYEDVRKSIFDEIATEIEDRKLEGEFSYSRSDNSTMVITHKSGNKFIPFGASNAKSLKSIKDATHILCEEFDQFTEVDFGFLFSRLRTKKAITQFIGIFNSEPLNTGHWLRKTFFENDVKSDLQPLKIFGTYRDNFFINQVEYENKLKLIANGRMHVFKAIADGLFGIKVNNNPFFYAFNREKSYRPDLKFEIESGYIDLSFDFNKSPTTLICGQMQKIGFVVFDVILADNKTYSEKSALESVCILFKNKYPQIEPYRIRVTGDASGRNGSSDRAINVNFYSTIKKELNVVDANVDKYVRSANLPHALSGDIINHLFVNIPVYFTYNCLMLVDEIEMAEIDDNGTLNSWKKDTMKSGGGHMVDAVRYLITDLWVNTPPKEWRAKINQLKLQYDHRPN